MRFRQQALRQMEAPEQLDHVVRLASPRHWLLGVALAGVVAAAVGWASVGRIAQTWSASGVLVDAQGISTLDATGSGAVEQVLVADGAVVKVGTPLYTVRAQDGTLTTVTAPWQASVVNLLVAPGNYVTPGSPIATFEPIAGPGDQLVAALFVPETAVQLLHVGEAVSVDVPAASEASFGHLSGSVSSVGSAPETSGSLQQFLGASADTSTLLADGPVVRVIVRLAVASGSGTTGSPLWSKASPPYQLPVMSQADASFTISDEHPFDWLVSS